MIDPIQSAMTTPAVGPAAAAGTAPAAGAADGKDFKSFLLDSLDEVARLQKQADEGVTKLATGQTDNVSEVFGAVKKAEVAFSLLMEIRNKLMDAYTEIRDMRV